MSRDGAVIVKRFSRDHREHFLRERAGLALLSSVPQLDGFVPRLQGDDESTLTLWMENVPERGAYAEIISGSQISEGASILRETAHRLGILHGHARSLAAAFLSRVPEQQTPGSTLRASIPAVASFLRLALRDANDGEFAAHSEFQAQLRSVASAVDEPSGLTTLTLGDLAPSNILLGLHGPVFIDLEYCSVRHAFYDAMFWHCICPVPPRVADSMDAAYCEGLRFAGAAINPESFRREMLLFASHRLFWTLSWNMDELMKRDREVVPGISMRATLLRHLGEYVRLANMQDLERDVLLRVVARLDDRLSRLWADHSGGG
jgi:hypothetical protein